MAEYKDANTRDSISNLVERIANAICGEEAEPYTGPQDRYRHALDRVASHLEGSGSTAGASQVANQEASTATDVEGLVTDFNALLTKLKAAGLMEPDADNNG